MTNWNNQEFRVNTLYPESQCRFKSSTLPKKIWVRKTSLNQIANIVTTHQERLKNARRRKWITWPTIVIVTICSMFAPISPPIATVVLLLSPISRIGEHK